MSTNTSIFSILRNIHLINLFNLGILKKEAHNIFLGICPPNIPIIRHMVSRCQVYPILGQNIGSWIPYRPHRMKKLYTIYFSLLVTPFDVNIPLSLISVICRQMVLFDVLLIAFIADKNYSLDTSIIIKFITNSIEI